MRGVACLCFAICAQLAGLAAAGDSFPYTASVIVDDAAVRSGPGRVHYATDRLSRERKVQVWRHDPGGWCAIRPPEGSFSLVLLRNLHLNDADDVAEVADDNVTAWIGSRLGEIEGRMWQVRLERGEPVQFLGKVEKRDGVSGVAQVWAKITPPAGEFRWIHAGHIQPMDDVVEPVASVAASEEETQTTASGWTNRSAPRTTGRRRELSLTSLVSESDAPTISASTTDPHARSEATSEDDFQSQVDALSVQLSLMVSGAPEAWQFDELRKQATTLVGRSETESQRGQARLIVDRINAFEAVRRKLQSDDLLDLTQSPPETDMALPISGTFTTEAVGTGVKPASFVDPLAPRYDGRGWLIQVHSRQAGVPEYALADDRGGIKQLVTPAPGVNLHRYLQQEIGVFGKQGIIQDLGTPHVSVRRVIVLSRHR